MTTDRIRIPAVAIDAPIVAKPVGSDGALPDPDTPDDVVLYDFSENFTQYGGFPGSGNVVMYGQPDSGRKSCQNGTILPPCDAVFWYLTNLSAGDAIFIDWEGERYEYTVVSLCTLPRTDWTDKLLLPADGPILTLMTDGGGFSKTTLSYSNSDFVRAEATPGTLDSACAFGATSTRTHKPISTPTPRPPIPVSITSLPETVKLGEPIDLEIQAKQGARCTVRIFSDDGTPEYGVGLNMIQSSTGVLKTTLSVGDRLTPGTKRLQVDCGGEPDSRELVVTE